MCFDQRKSIRIERVKFIASMAKKEMTCIELAHLAGVSRGTISGIKTGRRCSPETALKLAAVLGDEILIKESEVPENNA